VPSTIHPDAATSLALAMVASSTAPLVLLDADFKVLGVSRSFSLAFQVNASGAVGRPFFALGSGEWNTPQLRSLLDATAGGADEIEAYEMDLVVPGREARTLVVNARRLDYGDADNVRLLLTIADVTQVRLSDKLKDDLLREKAVLLQEVQHRVANSLQIIASVILQTARKSQSEETRIHLHDTHQRVMSVALLQQQLAATSVGEVELRDYFNRLCASIGASMIRDHGQISLRTSIDQSAVSADVSVSLGLIVTELVINALKHAFPGGEKGKILVGYGSDGPNWTLSVSDDGVGMPPDSGSAKRGLGSSIVEALARQLHAGVHVRGAKPGTKVSIESDSAAVATARI
jgi:two-component sensor histidine kinase